MAEARGGGYAWTEAGRLYAWDTHQAPTLQGSFAAIDHVTADSDLGELVRLRDGRVFARTDAPPWRRTYGGEGEWLEVPELRDSQVVSHGYHQCALHPGGTVTCWGGTDGFSSERDRTQQPVEVAALRGATQIFAAQRRTCGLMPGDVLRCVGLEAGEYSPVQPAPSPTDGYVDIALGALRQRR